LRSSGDWEWETFVEDTCTCQLGGAQGSHSRPVFFQKGRTLITLINPQF
jgi:hypothetical protein